MRKLVKGKKYHIYWHDTLSIEAWCDEEQIYNQAKNCAENQETVGFYVTECFDYLVFASIINNSGNMLPYANVSLIPKGCIKKIKQ